MSIHILITDIVILSHHSLVLTLRIVIQFIFAKGASYQPPFQKEVLQDNDSAYC